MSVTIQYTRLETVRTLFEREGSKYGICPCLLAAICNNESGGIAMAVNPDSMAAGLMQIAKGNFPAFGWTPPTRVDRTLRIGYGGTGWNNAGENIHAGAEILKNFLRRTGDIEKALQLYVGASTMARARPYIDSVLADTITLAGRYAAYGKWVK